MIKKQLLFIFVLIGTFTLIAHIAHAVSTSITLNVTGEKLEEGSIVTLNEGEYTLSSKEYDPNVVGVITKNPTISIEDKNLQDYVQVVTQGEVLVRITTTEGNIDIGDRITTSNQMGIGKKATENGDTIGIALESLQIENTTNDTELLLIQLDMQEIYLYNDLSSNVNRAFKKGLIDASTSPLTYIKYLLGLIITITTLVGTFIYFTKESKASIESIGRNPLQKKTFYKTFFISFIFTIILLFFSIGVITLILLL